MKKALVVEGGGMRGAHTCGALMALAERGKTDFDVVVAASAGACTAAYLVSRQFDLFPVIWTKYLHDGRFVDLKRLPTRRSVMDLDFLIHRVFKELDPLDVEAIRRSPTKFFIVSTHCETGTPVYFDAHKDPILNALKASAAMPIAYRHPVVIDGRTFIDGGVTDPVPVQKAIDEGCDDITVLLTRPEGYRKKIPLVNILPRLYARKFPRLAEAFMRRYEAYNRSVDLIESGKLPARVTVIRPKTKLPVSRLSTNLEKIRATIRLGERDAREILSPST
ncbi:MAG TPA: patatin family protein [bacterium]|nr:patatin family protein [bacterium]